MAVALEWQLERRNAGGLQFLEAHRAILHAPQPEVADCPQRVAVFLDAAEQPGPGAPEDFVERSRFPDAGSQQLRFHRVGQQRLALRFFRRRALQFHGLPQCRQQLLLEVGVSDRSSVPDCLLLLLEQRQGVTPPQRMQHQVLLEVVDQRIGPLLVVVDEAAADAVHDERSDPALNARVGLEYGTRLLVPTQHDGAGPQDSLQAVDLATARLGVAQLLALRRLKPAFGHDGFADVASEHPAADDQQGEFGFGFAQWFECRIFHGIFMYSVFRCSSVRRNGSDRSPSSDCTKHRLPL